MNLQDQLNNLNSLTVNDFKPLKTERMLSNSLLMSISSYDPNDPVILARAKQREARKAAQAQEMRDHKEVVK